MGTSVQSAVHLPRVEIKFCVQCKWNLRAAYYAQELLQTFSNTIGEIALVPVTGGTFTITLHHDATDALTSETTPNLRRSSIGHIGEGPFALSPSTNFEPQIMTSQIWDRKTDGGFPETKELKNRIRNIVDPQRDMGHIDRSLNKGKTMAITTMTTTTAEGENTASKYEHKGSVGPGQGPANTEWKPPQPSYPIKREAGLGEDEDDGDEEGMHDCEECRLAAREALEDQIGRVNSRY